MDRAVQGLRETILNTKPLENKICSPLFKIFCEECLENWEQALHIK